MHIVFEVLCNVFCIIHILMCVYNLISPVNNKRAKEAIRVGINLGNTDECPMYATSYYLPGYITSSVLDFYNFNKSSHGDHTDTGLLSLILFNYNSNSNVTVDNQLTVEIHNNETNSWINIEKEFYNYCIKNNISFNEYGLIMFGDQIEYASALTIRGPFLYRINPCQSMKTIFKLRASPLRGPFLRYQEDYVIANHNIDIDVNATNALLVKSDANQTKKNVTDNGGYGLNDKLVYMAGAVIVGAIAVGTVYWMRNKQQVNFNLFNKLNL